MEAVVARCNDLNEVLHVAVLRFDVLDELDLISFTATTLYHLRIYIINYIYLM